MFNGHKAMNTDMQAGRESEKADAVAAIRNAITKVEAKGRQIDAWERMYLVGAIELLGCARYADAVKYADWAATPVMERSATQTSNLSDGRIGIHSLQRTLDDVATWPVRETPDLSLRVHLQLQPEA
jgi:hypothetical protein